MRVVLLVDDPEERRGLEVPPYVRGVMLEPFEIETLARMVRQAMLGRWGLGTGEAELLRAMLLGGRYTAR